MTHIYLNCSCSCVTKKCGTYPHENRGQEQRETLKKILKNLKTLKAITVDIKLRLGQVRLVN